MWTAHRSCGLWSHVYVRYGLHLARSLHLALLHEQRSLYAAFNLHGWRYVHRRSSLHRR
jgi:hypothetical protein